MSFWNRWEPQTQRDSTRKIMAGAQRELPSMAVAQAQRGDQLLLGYKMKPELLSGGSKNPKRLKEAAAKQCKKKKTLASKGGAKVKPI